MYKKYYSNGEEASLDTGYKISLYDPKVSQEIIFDEEGAIVQNVVRVYVNCRFIGYFNQVLKEKGRLWFLTTFGKHPDQLVSKECGKIRCDYSKTAHGEVEPVMFIIEDGSVDNENMQV